MPLRFDRDALMKMVHESDGFKQLQDEANERVRAIAREVNATHAGRPVDEVDAELRGRLETAGVSSPTQPGFTQLVQAISRGELD
jgi:glyceraldehyde-3-phosphate dehydrogenase/erythrose-4-phosphate dehydrogenase